MASGGARAHSGPPRDPDALRRDRKSDPKWTTLPASGRAGPAPEWPLSGKAAHFPALTPSWISEIEDEEKKQRLLDQIESEASALFSRELEIWTGEWRRPQAVQWEQNGQEIEVALYVRSLVAAEAPNAKVTLRTLVKQQQEALGLSLPGLARNLWKIKEVEDDPEASRSEPKAQAARSRFKVIDGDGDKS
ncbi:MAG TPA: hypothetical protein VEW07_06310 [Solirubrobacterales bacterium]|nr:hypothetical protein [Solirubrobacterales bacterium]